MRAATHAGSWYSDSREQLELHIKNAFEKVKDDSTSKVKYIIAPHAGYAYSLETAAYSYKKVDLTSVKRIFILGPSHCFYLSGCAVDKFDALATPLGALKVDSDVINKLKESNAFRTIRQTESEEEHSIELHLPLVRFIIDRFGADSIKIVPLLVGDFDSRTGDDLANLLLPYFNELENLFIISSDFCHYGRRFCFTQTGYEHESLPIYKGIELLDLKAVEHITNHNLDGYLEYLKNTKNTICGRNPIQLLLKLISLSSLEIKSKLLSYTQVRLTTQLIIHIQSSQVVEPYESSVSYAAIVGTLE